MRRWNRPPQQRKSSREHLAHCGQHQQKLRPPHSTPVQTQCSPQLNVHVGTAVCKAASLCRTVPKAALFLLAAMKASGELSREGLPVSPRQCRDFPASKAHAYTETRLQTCTCDLSPGKTPAPLDFLPGSPASGPFISIPSEPSQGVLQLPFPLPCKQTGVPLSQERGSHECLERRLPPKSSTCICITNCILSCRQGPGKCPCVTSRGDTYGAQRLGPSSTVNIQD